MTLAPAVSHRSPYLDDDSHYVYQNESSIGKPGENAGAIMKNEAQSIAHQALHRTA